MKKEMEELTRPYYVSTYRTYDMVPLQSLAYSDLGIKAVLN